MLIVSTSFNEQQIKNAKKVILEWFQEGTWSNKYRIVQAKNYSFLLKDIQYWVFPAENENERKTSLELVEQAVRSLIDEKGLQQKGNYIGLAK